MELVADVVVSRYKTNGVPITVSEWRDLSKYVCKDLAAGGSGLWTTAATKTVLASVQHDLSAFNRDAAIASDCPGAVTPPGEHTYSGFSDQMINAMRVNQMEQETDYNTKLEQYFSAVYDYGNRYNVNVIPAPFDYRLYWCRQYGDVRRRVAVIQR
ncbi:hypothetical protein AB4Y72_15015 [Arthrobacter sp. YAF34]|uniref:hypothetical protein n=1 Tax=Arthrobacter sp. YAF34 TaxID=3233083 RepID=UPI003F90D27A